ncbi:leucine-rich melanocyte differentiation-associated protein-like [Vespa mandarinia]|uniref:leucine-rich melanocyte differentiation-associated protein-like n=1 Tax=Vespa mandarinia TaxID=7446 RepID=UPI0016092CCA|nr:leucine-rich melanocyte differentiation-associated protein-like [Vespa mandarinia]XP_035722749.1 leucine-rich melanocyte differentiation-associated protein-like [Vespa mandarinia]
MAAERQQQDFNRSALTIDGERAWYTGQRAHKIPNGLVHVVGCDCLSLDLSYNELTSVMALKDFSRLEELILDNNRLRDLKTLPFMPSLTTLSLNNNKITNIDDALEKIRDCCPIIGYVSLLGNPGCPDQLTNPNSTDENDYERYRLYAIYTLPSTLRFLDSRVITLKERNDGKNRGRYSKTIKAFTNQTNDNLISLPLPNEFDDAYFNIKYTPLPITNRTPQDHRGAFGKCKYRYSGKNSEGNRFIFNKDL